MDDDKRSGKFITEHEDEFVFENKNNEDKK